MNPVDVLRYGQADIDGLIDRLPPGRLGGDRARRLDDQGPRSGISARSRSVRGHPGAVPRRSPDTDLTGTEPGDVQRRPGRGAPGLVRRCRRERAPGREHGGSPIGRPASRSSAGRRSGRSPGTARSTRSTTCSCTRCTATSGSTARSWRRSSTDPAGADARPAPRRPRRRRRGLSGSRSAPVPPAGSPGRRSGCRSSARATPRPAARAARSCSVGDDRRRPAVAEVAAPVDRRDLAEVVAGRRGR